MKYYRVYTIADGYHDGPIKELSCEEFKALFIEYSQKYTLWHDGCLFHQRGFWLQFTIFEEDGVALGCDYNAG